MASLYYELLRTFSFVADVVPRYIQLKIPWIILMNAMIFVCFIKVFVLKDLT